MNPAPIDDCEGPVLASQGDYGLQARGIAEGIIATVSLMSKSGLPCYGRGHPLENLKKRFHLEMSDSQAAAFMRSTVHDAYDKVLSFALF